MIAEIVSISDARQTSHRRINCSLPNNVINHQVCITDVIVTNEKKTSIVMGVGFGTSHRQKGVSNENISLHEICK